MIRAVAVAVMVVAGSSVAVAQSAGAQAEVLFRQGRDLLAAGNIAEACSAFEESQKLDPAVTTLLNLAGCREKLGQFSTAWGLFLDAARQTRSGSNTANQQFHDVAQDRAQKLEPRVSRLTIHVPGQSQVDGLEITKGTERVGSGLWNRALPVDGGTYTITARAPGAPGWSTQVTVALEHDARTVEIPDLRSLPRDAEKPMASPPRPPPAAAPAPSVTPPVDSPADPPRGSGNAVPLILGASALALLGGGLGLELWAEASYDAAKSEQMIQARRDSLYDAANVKRISGVAVAATGVAVGATAVWLYLRGRHDERRGQASARLLVVPSGNGLAIVGEL